MSVTTGLFYVFSAVLLGGFRAVDDPNAALAAPGGLSNTQQLGKLIYTEYIYPLEIAAAILLVAMIAAIALTMRKRKDTKVQDPSAQVRVRRADRVRLVSMPAEPKVGEQAASTDKPA